MKKKNHKYTQPTKPGEIDWTMATVRDEICEQRSREASANFESDCLFLRRDGNRTLWSLVPMEVAG